MSIRLAPLIGIFVTVLAISGGQLLFKLAANRANAAQSVLAPDALGVLFAAVVLYGGATLVWVAVLRYVPLSIAYVFMSLSFVIVPVLAAVLFKEALTARFFVGLCLIIAGILVSLSSKAS